MPVFNKKIGTTIVTATLSIVPTLAFALPDEPVGDQQTLTSQIRETIQTNLGKTGDKAGILSNLTIYDVIGNLIGISLAVVGVIFLVEAIRGGYDWMTAAGNATQVTDAKSRLFNGALGAIVIFAAYMLTSFAINRIGLITGVSTGN